MGGQAEAAPQNLVWGLEAMVDWLRRSQLKLNPSKTERGSLALGGRVMVAFTCS